MSSRRLTTYGLRDWLRVLRKACPPILPVIVRRRRMRGATAAYTSMQYFDDGHPSHFLLVMDSKFSPFEAQLVLVHEWAHCLSWREGDHPSLSDHDASYWLSHGVVYDALLSSDD